MVLGVLGRVPAVVAGAALVRAVVGAEGQLPRLPAAVRPTVGESHVQPHPEGGVASDKLITGLTKFGVFRIGTNRVAGCSSRRWVIYDDFWRNF